MCKSRDGGHTASGRGKAKRPFSSLALFDPSDSGIARLLDLPAPAARVFEPPGKDVVERSCEGRDLVGL
jgi:hypothetical protein